MSKKDADQLVTALRQHLAENNSPLTVEKRGGHWHVVTENGSSIASFGSTPSDHRFKANASTLLRRRGIVPGDWRP
jgi:hypothetical protein